MKCIGVIEIPAREELAVDRNEAPFVVVLNDGGTCADESDILKNDIWRRLLVDRHDHPVALVEAKAASVGTFRMIGAQQRGATLVGEHRLAVDQGPELGVWV